MPSFPPEVRVPLQRLGPLNIGDPMKIFGYLLTLAGLFLVSCSTPPPSAAGPESQAPDEETVESARETAGQKPPAIAKGGSLDAQKRQFLRDRHLENARRLMEGLKYEEAEAELTRARQEDPGHPEVNRLLALVQEQLGQRPGAVQSRGDVMAQLYRARLEKLKLEARDAFQRAQEHLKHKEYFKAIQCLEEVKLHIQYGEAVKWGTLEKETDDLLAQAKKDHESYLETKRTKLEKETFTRLRQAEAKAQLQRSAKVDAIWQRALKNWISEDFEAAATCAEEILAIEPTHISARQLFDLAEKARRERNKREYIRDRAEEYRKWKDATAEVKIPYMDILNKPSRDKWAEITKKRKYMGNLGLSQEVDPAVEALEKKLDSERLRGTFQEGTAFKDVVNHMVTYTGLPVVLSPEARTQIEEDATEVEMDLQVPVTARHFLNLLVRRNEQLTYVVQDGVVLITTKAKAVNNRVVRIHDINDLAFGLTNFAAPKIDSMKIDESSEVGPMGGVIGDPIKNVDPDELSTMIKETIAPSTWEAEGMQCEPVGNQLIVVHTPEVQRKIKDFLNALRRYHTAIVTIDSKFLEVNQSWIQELGVDWRGLGGEGDNPAELEAQLDDLTNGLDDNASQGFDNSGSGVTTDPAAPPTAGLYYNDGGDGGLRSRTENIFGTTLGNILSTKGGATIGVSILDDIQMRFLVRMVEKSIHFQVVNSQSLSVMNTQRANVTMVQQISYVKDFDVEVASAAYIADPVVDVLQDGIVLDVRPTISFDRKYITLELRPTVATLQRPIPTFSTSLAGATLAVTLQLPKLKVRTVKTTVKVPDGGSVLIGGLKEIYNNERKASIPWLSEIPLVSLFFKNEGKVDENSNLMILVRAHMQDVAEIMADY